MAILEVNKMNKTYIGKVNYEALKNITLSVEEGEFVAIMGPSGSGKTTFLNCISTIDAPTGGTIHINKISPYALKEEELAAFRRQQLGFVFQDFNLVHTLTVQENILLPLALDRVAQDVMMERLAKVTTILGIQHLLTKRTFEISGGQAQRVAIARAIIHEPTLLLADEPTGNLDTKSVKDVMQLFTTVNQDMNTTILMVTHDAYVASFCQRVVFIKDGEFYNEVYKGNNRQQFYQSIVDNLAFLGGVTHDFS